MWWIALGAAMAGAGAGDAPFDHSHASWAAVLEGAVRPQGVDYGQLAGRTARLDAYLASLEEAPVDQFSKAQQLAFWVNAYNALTVDVLLDEGLPSSIRDLDGGKVWTTRRFRVGGSWVTLDDIEHRRARPLADGRVHAVLNCASKGCPPLPAEPVRASRLDADLDRAAAVWVDTNAYEVDGTTVRFSKVFEWFAEDFRAHGVEPLKAARGFVVAHGDAEARAAVQREGLELAWGRYDWSLNRSP